MSALDKIKQRNTREHNELQEERDDLRALLKTAVAACERRGHEFGWMIQARGYLAKTRPNLEPKYIEWPMA